MSADTSGTPVVVAIDGPAGSGKSTIAKRLASDIGLPYLDTGAMYRAVTLAVIDSGIDVADAEAIGQMARSAEISVGDGASAGGGGDVTVHLGTVDVSDEIRTDRVTRAVSSVSAVPAVRVELVERQRRWVVDRSGGVLEGRDIGTVVFPDAALKIYLTASAEVRARRRAAQQGTDDWQTIARDIERRDAADSSRADSPLAEASDAFVFDTSDHTIDVVVERLAEEFRRRVGNDG